MASTRMMALLGLLAVAGYQHRDQLGALLGRVTGQGDGQAPLGPGSASANGGGLLSGLGSLFGGGASAGGGIAGGLTDLIDHFTGNGHGETANSWVKSGADAKLGSSQLEEALGEDTITTLTAQTGLSRTELLARLSTVLPTAVDKMTPEGRVPTSAEAAGWNLPSGQPAT